MKKFNQLGPLDKVNGDSGGETMSSAITELSAASDSLETGNAIILREPEGVDKLRAIDCGGCGSGDDVFDITNLFLEDKT